MKKLICYKRLTNLSNVVYLVNDEVRDQPLLYALPTIPFLGPQADKTAHKYVGVE